MFYNLLYPLADQISVFNLFRYLTFRTGGAGLTPPLLCFPFCPGILGRPTRRHGEGPPPPPPRPGDPIPPQARTPAPGGAARAPPAESGSATPSRQALSPAPKPPWRSAKRLPARCASSTAVR